MTVSMASPAAWAPGCAAVYLRPTPSPTLARKLLEGWGVFAPVCVLSTVSRTGQVPDEYFLT